MTRTLRTAALVLGLILGAPAAAGAATATITDDAGADAPLTAPTTIRNMSPQLKLAFAAAEKRYAVTIVGPGGAAAAVTTACKSVGLYDPVRIGYQGNGAYTAAVTTTTDATDATCSSGQTATFPFAIAASTTVSSPGARLRTRRPNAPDLLVHAFTLGVNPGSEFTEVRYARNGKVQADGSLPGMPAGGLVPAEQATPALQFGTPGNYTVIARPATAGSFGPWSQPIVVPVLAPFDLSTPLHFSDQHGPVYKIRGAVRAADARGRKIVVRLARGAKGGKFHLLRTIKIGKGGRFSLRFRFRGAGTNRLRLHFKGTARVARGTVIQAFRPK